MHYVVNLLGLELLRLCGAYEARNSARRCSHLDKIDDHRRTRARFRARVCKVCTAVHMPCTSSVRASCMPSLLQARASPLTLRLLALSAVVGFAPGLNNVSLKYNGLGFYQVLPLPLPLPLTPASTTPLSSTTASASARWSSCS